jgi:SH3-like domain-containing protein
MSRVLALRDFSIRTAAILLLAQICGAAGAQEAPGETLQPVTFRPYTPKGIEIRVSEFSGQPVPRYASLRYDEVNGRHGPAPDQPVDWTYRRRGLPVIIVKETREWRKVRDPSGDEVWVHVRTLAGERTVMTTGPGAVLRRGKPDAQEVATFDAGAVMALRGCDQGWCKVEAGGREGFVMERLLWGAADLPGAPEPR